MSLGSRIRDPEKTLRGSRTRIQGSKSTADHGSVSGKLEYTVVFFLNIMSRILPGTLGNEPLYLFSVSGYFCCLKSGRWRCGRRTGRTPSYPASSPWAVPRHSSSTWRSSGASKTRNFKEKYRCWGSRSQEAKNNPLQRRRKRIIISCFEELEGWRLKASTVYGGFRRSILYFGFEQRNVRFFKRKFFPLLFYPYLNSPGFS